MDDPTHSIATTGDVWTALLMTFLAGISTSIGALLPFFISIKNVGYLSISLAFSAGVMIYVSFFEILHESVENFEEHYSKYATLLATACFFAGMGVCAIMDWIVHRLDPGHEHHSAERIPEMEEDLRIVASRSGSPVNGKSCCSNCGGVVGKKENENEKDVESGLVMNTNGIVKVKNGTEDLNDNEECLCEKGYVGICDAQQPDQRLCSKASTFKDALPAELQENSANLMRLSFVSAVAITFHNFPEGVATFISALKSTTLGLPIAIAIAIHNIPEGICVSIPVYYCTGSKSKAVLWGTLAGLAEPLGALVALGIIRLSTGSVEGDVFSHTAYGVMFGMVSGMMVFISMAELLPTAQKYDPKGIYVTKAVVAGMFVMAVSLVLPILATA